MFYFISKREAFVGTYVGCVKQVMYLIEVSIMDIIYFMKPVHNFLCEGRVQIVSVLWHFNICI